MFHMQYCVESRTRFKLSRLYFCHSEYQNQLSLQMPTTTQRVIAMVKQKKKYVTQKNAGE